MRHRLRVRRRGQRMIREGHALMSRRNPSRVMTRPDEAPRDQHQHARQRSDDRARPSTGGGRWCRRWPAERLEDGVPPGADR